MGLFDGLGGALISGAASLLGGERRNSAQADQAEAANAFSAQQFATRYQTTVKDMQAAGLNPMLAYSQGGGSPPSGQQGAMSDTVTPAVQSFNQTYATSNQAKLASAQVANVDADTENKKAQADLIAAQAAQAWSSAGQANANVGLINANVQKVIEETKNIPVEGQRLRYAIQLLAEQAALAAQKGETEVSVRNQIAATISKLRSETTLLNFDVDAANTLGNMGRLGKEAKTVVDVLRGLIRK